LQASKCHVQDFFTIKGTLSKQYRLMNLYVSLSLLSRRLILPSACFCTLKRPMDFSDFFSILQDFHCRSDHPKIALFFFFFFFFWCRLFSIYASYTNSDSDMCFSVNIVMMVPFQRNWYPCRMH